MNEQNYYGKKVSAFFRFFYKKVGLFAQTFINVEVNLHFITFFFLFVGAFFYTTSSLPYGRFYTRIGGNVGMMCAYLFVFSYLAFTVFRRALFVELLQAFLYNRVLVLGNNKLAL